MAKNNFPGRILKGTKSQPSLKGASGVWTLDEALQYHRANQWPQPNLYQPVANSLRLKYQVAGTYPAYQNSYLNRAPARAGNVYAWTWSGWFKYSQGGSNACIFGATTGYNASGDYRTQIQVDKSGGITFSHTQIQIAGYVNFVWTPILRDPSAWYHLVIVYDSLNATTANRVLAYLNGVQLTATTTTCPQGQATVINNTSLGTGTNNQRISGINDYYGNSAYWYDGQIAEMYLIDGYKLQPTLFGQYDSNNAWVPIPYTGSYGTNGFYLPFTNAQTSQTLGYDASLTGTTTYGVDQDPYRGSVALHLTGNGPAGGQNNTFEDSSINNIAITRYGTPTQGSFSPFPFNTNTTYNPAVHGASVFFANTTSANNYLVTAATSTLEFGSSNFTIELWWYPMSTSRQAIYHGSYSADYSVGIDYNSTGSSYTIGIWASSNGTTWTSLISSDSGGNGIGSQPINQNAWNHIVYQRNGTTWQSYINGVLDRNLTGLSGTIPTRSSYGKAIGCWWQTSSMSTATGYISGFNIIVGSAKYNGSFTPTNRPFGTLTNNLIGFSEDFANSGWGKDGGISVTPNYAVAPDGTPSMTLMSRVAGSLTNWSQLTWANYVGTGNNSGKTYTFSVWVQATSGTVSGSIAISDVNYNTSTLSFTATTTPQRYSMSYSGPSGVWNSSSAYIGGGVNLNSVGTSVLVWGAQLEVASSATNYTPTPANYATAPSLLLNFANSAVVDTAGATNLITFNNATITSASKYGSGALTFNGSSSDYITTTDSGNCFTFGTNNFTVETWVLFNSTGITQAVMAAYNSIGNDSTNPVAFTTRTAGYINFEAYFGTFDYLQGVLGPVAQVAISTGTWYHLAISRNNGTLMAFFNGQLVGQVSVGSLSMAAPAGNLSIGRAGQYNGQYFSGQVDDFRVTKGVARYTSSFTPPARALPETGGKSFVTQNVNAGVVRSFTTVGTTSWTAPSDVTQIEILVVAGGGSGSIGGGGGGGGAGGLIYNNQYPVTPGQTYTVTVGSGGTGTTGGPDINGSAGGNSVFGNLIAIGGGQGAHNGYAGQTGGSGGGGYGTSTSAPGSGTAGQGFAGAAGGSGSGVTNGGGGGGAGAVGGTGSSTNGGVGGIGLQFGISGTPTYYAGGGAGGTQNSSGTSQAGGLGGGGAGGGAPNSSGSNATANTGGGGGGASYNTASVTSGNGGSGIVIVRYTTTAVGNTSDATTDNLVDSPTLYGHDFGNGGEVVGNYATWNALDTNSVYLTNGNLSNTAGGGNYGVRGTIAVSSGLWYWEFSVDQTSPTNHHGVWSVAEYMGTNYIGQTAGSWGMYDSNGNKRNNGSFLSYGSGFNQGDIGMIALDMNNGYIYWGKNGVWFNSGNPATQTNPAFTNLSGYTVAPATLQYTAASYNFGQRPWAYTPPAGFNALTLKNLPRPTGAAATPNQYFDAVLWTGTGSSQTISMPSGFTPDLVWIKDRSNTDSHRILDTTRGATKFIASDLTNAEATDSQGLTAFTTSGFTLGTDSSYNYNARTYVGWCWKAGGTSVSNTAGTITSQVSANTTSGFSIVSYTGTGVQATVGHGLGATPSFIVLKNRTDGTRGWPVWHTALGTAGYMYLNSTQVSATDNSTWGTMTSTTFGLGNGTTPNTSWNETGSTFIAYCWTAIPGFSQFGTWQNNNSNNGTFIYTGFKPAMILMKNTDNVENWYIIDAKRPGYNVAVGSLLTLSPNLSSAEPVSNANTATVDIVSNGFKIRTSNPASGEISYGTRNYIYAAFAANPFGNTNGTAR